MSEFGNPRRGVGCALLAAGLFGLSTPLAKSVSPHVEPMLLAGLLYLGSGIGLGAYSMLRRLRQPSAVGEAALQRTDVPWLLGTIVMVAGAVLIVVLGRHRV